MDSLYVNVERLENCGRQCLATWQKKDRKESMMRRLARSSAAGNVRQLSGSEAFQARGFAPGLVIFDKDGTLIDFKAMWGTWIARLSDNLAVNAKFDRVEIEHFTRQVMGFDKETGEVDPKSPLCCTPMGKIKDVMVEFVGSRKKKSPEEALEIVNMSWHMPSPSADARPLTDLPKMFEFLKARGVKIAICTTDDRDVTEETMQQFQVDHMVDALLGGDDLHVQSKPNPEQIFHICEVVKVHPSRTVMVGDTQTDMLMGSKAEVGLKIGLVNGAGSLEDIAEHADIILPSMHKFIPFFEKCTLPVE